MIFLFFNKVLQTGLTWIKILIFGFEQNVYVVYLKSCIPHPANTRARNETNEMKTGYFLTLETKDLNLYTLANLMPIIKFYCFTSHGSSTTDNFSYKQTK